MRIRMYVCRALSARKPQKVKWQLLMEIAVVHLTRRSIPTRQLWKNLWTFKSVKKFEKPDFRSIQVGLQENK